MAAQNLAQGSVGSTLATLAANVVDTITFLNTDVPVVEIVSPASNTVGIWYTLDGTDPTVGGANSYYLPPGMVVSKEPTSNPTVVKLIANGTPQYRVQRSY